MFGLKVILYVSKLMRDSKLAPECDVYIYAALEMFPNKGPRVIGDLGLSSLEVGFTYFYLASSIKFMNPSQSVFKIRQKLLFQTQINHIYHLYNGTQRQK